MTFMIQTIALRRSPSWFTSASGRASAVRLCCLPARTASAQPKHLPWRFSTASLMSSAWGANTQGVFSDVLGRKLPNGWSFGLPNEIYLTKDGKAFDGPGVPPDIEVPIFPAEDLANGRDSTLNKALELLASRNE